jgi:hypothetical protein
MSTHLVLQAHDVTEATSSTPPAPRCAPPIYNQYTRVAAHPGYERDREPHLALFRPLFTTSFLLDDFVAGENFFGAGAGAVVLSSASSKTALGLAFLLRARGRCRVVGLTSRAHEAFVRQTGYYDTVLAYDAVPSLPREPPAVFVDFAGNGTLLSAVHRQLGDGLRFSSRVGVTHWDRMGAADDLPGPAPVFFFAPDQARKRVAEWGADVFQARVAEATRGFLDSTTRWLRVVESRAKPRSKRSIAPWSTARRTRRKATWSRSPIPTARRRRASAAGGGHDRGRAADRSRR